MCTSPQSARRCRCVNSRDAGDGRQFSTYGRYPDGWQGHRGKVDETTRHLAAAGAWGLFPNRDAVYINHKPGVTDSGCYEATYFARLAFGSKIASDRARPLIGRSARIAAMSGHARLPHARATQQITSSSVISRRSNTD
jgi:hypothetical protein